MCRHSHTKPCYTVNQVVLSVVLNNGGDLVWSLLKLFEDFNDGQSSNFGMKVHAASEDNYYYSKAHSLLKLSCHLWSPIVSWWLRTELTPRLSMLFDCSVSMWKHFPKQHKQSV